MKTFFVLLLSFFITACEKKWSYEGRFAPAKWGDLKEEYKFCKIGYNQSPIDINQDFSVSDLKFFYQDSLAEKEKLAYNLQIEFDRHDYLLRGKKKYFLRYLAFHHPSEHLIAEKPYSLEMQIYHKSEDEQWLVLAVFLEIGDKNSAFIDLLQLLQSKQNQGKINLAKILKESDQIFFYDGSFTTPPCSEGVKWYVMKTPLYISKEQMNQIIKQTIFVRSNARLKQKFNPEKF